MLISYVKLDHTLYSIDYGNIDNTGYSIIQRKIIFRCLCPCLEGRKDRCAFTYSECSRLVRIVVSCAQMREAIETHPQTIVPSMLLQ